MRLILPFILLLSAAGGCAPAEIGADIPRADMTVPQGPPEPSDVMRYPVFGFSQTTPATQRNAYFLNRPETASHFQRGVRSDLSDKKRAGTLDYSNIPEAASPFRQ